MQIIVNPHKLEIVQDEFVNEKEIDVSECVFEFNDIPDNYVKEAYFTLNDNTYKQLIINDKCKFPYEVLEERGMVEIGVVCFETQGTETIKRYNPSPVYFNTLDGSLKEAENTEPVTPSDKEQIEQALNDGLNNIQNAIDEVDNKIVEVNNAIDETNNLNIDVNKVDKEATIELTKKDGTQKEVKIYDGVSLQFMWRGTSLGIKTDDMQDYVFVNLQGVQGIPGPQGEPFRIKKTYSSVAEMNADFDNMQYGDYVMIASSIEIEDNAKLYTRGQTEWIFITDFSGATGIKGETGATPNIQIGNVTSGDTPNVTRTGTNENPILNFTLVKGEKGNTGSEGPRGATGNGISSVRKTSSSGLVDTYTITFTNGTTTTFDITNGEDGEVTQEQLDKVQSQLDMYKMLENALPKVEGEGESITLDNTAKSPMHLNFKGQIQQDSTTGKNLLPITNQDYTISGVNFKAEKGTIIISGTSTANITGFSMKNDNYFPVTLSAGTYYLSREVINSNVTINLISAIGETTIAQLVRNENTYSVSFTLSETTKMYLGFYIPSGLNITSGYIGNIMVSTSGGDYEPYTNGASPNPNYPQPIHIVSGNNEIKVCNKNLFNGSLFDGIEKNEDGTYKSTKYEQSSTPVTFRGKPNTTYRMCLFFKNGEKCSGTNPNNFSLNVDGTWKNITTISDGATFTTNEDGEATLRFGASSYPTIGQVNVYVLLTKTNAVTTFDDYVPHQEYTKEINLPVENLFDLDYAKNLNNYTTSITSTDYGNLTGYSLQLRPNTTYTISLDMKTWVASGAFIYALIAENGDTIKLLQYNGATSGSVTFTTTSSGIVYLGQRYGTSVERLGIFLETATIQIEPGTKANSYTPYGTTPIEVGSIGDYEDEFFKNTIDSKYYDSTLELDKWYLKKRIGKVVLDGSENWGQFNIENTGLGRALTSVDNVFYISNVPSVRSNKLIGTKYASSWTLPYECVSSASNNRFIVYLKDVADLTSFKNKLSSGYDFYYVLATPKNILLNDTLQETLDSFYSMQGQTNISQENNDLPFVIKASAIRDISNL